MTGGFQCGTTVPGRRGNTRSGGDVERSVGEHATESTQPCRKGAIRGNITALEAAYEEYELTGIKKLIESGDYNPCDIVFPLDDQDLMSRVKKYE